MLVGWAGRGDSARPSRDPDHQRDGTPSCRHRTDRMAQLPGQRGDQPGARNSTGPAGLRQGGRQVLRPSRVSPPGRRAFLVSPGRQGPGTGHVTPATSAKRNISAH
jgi:hypothetical protein